MASAWVRVIDSGEFAGIDDAGAAAFAGAFSLVCAGLGALLVAAALAAVCGSGGVVQALASPETGHCAPAHAAERIKTTVKTGIRMELSLVSSALLSLK
jgi:hypothetical protein